MNGKEKCEVLKSIRRDIAKANDIPLDIAECKHKGDCKGTCPRCEAEVKVLERELTVRRKRGLKIAVAGISAGLIAINTASCDIFDEISSRFGGDELQGDMAIESTDGMMPPPMSNTEEYVLDGDIAYPGEVDIIEGDIP